MSTHRFENDGFAVTPPLLSAAACMDIESAVTDIQDKGIGMRHLLDYSWCKELARKIREHPLVEELLLAGSVAVQCTYFEKSKEQNWLVPIHQDLSIPVQEKVSHAELTGWSEKEGSVFVQPPDSILQQMVAVRLHIDDCGPEDGPLKVVPGSHKAGRLSNEMALNERDSKGEQVCPVAKGAALLMRPLLLHASSKATGQSKRRVLHFVYGPPTLPYGLRWQYAV